MQENLSTRKRKRTMPRGNRRKRENDLSKQGTCSRYPAKRKVCWKGRV
jgi:hypothetical protein